MIKGSKTVYIYSSIVLFFVVFLLVLRSSAPEKRVPEDLKKVSVGNHVFSVEVVDTPEKRTLGLSGHAPLLPMHGMLFVFDEVGKYAFWMKDMSFPIDILWIGQDKKVVYIVEHLSPETYPNTYVSPQDALYVLELPAGTVEENHIILGEELGLP